MIHFVYKYNGIYIIYFEILFKISNNIYDITMYKTTPVLLFLKKFKMLVFTILLDNSNNYYIAFTKCQVLFIKQLW